MRRVSALIAVVVLLMGLVPMTVLANHGSGDSGNVSATVTPGIIGVTVTGQNLGYLVQDLGVSNIQPDGQTDGTTPNAAIKVENTGVVTSDWAIVGGASTGAGTNWAIAAAATTDVYAHRYDNAGTGSGAPTTPATLHTSSTLATGKTSGQTEFVWLQLDMPTASGATATQSLPITITAIQTP